MIFVSGFPAAAGMPLFIPTVYIRYIYVNIPGVSLKHVACLYSMCCNYEHQEINPPPLCPAFSYLNVVGRSRMIPGTRYYIACVYVCSSYQTVLSNRRQPSHPVSVPIPPTEIQVIYVVTKLRHSCIHIHVILQERSTTCCRQQSDLTT